MPFVEITLTTTLGSLTSHSFIAFLFDLIDFFMLFHYIPLLYLYEIFILIHIFIKVKFVTVIVTIV